MAKTIGYARPREPDSDHQTAELASAGATTIFTERQLARDADRPELRRALDALEPGDSLLVASLDRLARTPTELFYILEETRKRGAALRSLRENLVVGGSVPTEGRTHHIESDSSFMRHLGMILDFERAILAEWQRESINATKSRRDAGLARRRR